MGFLGIYLDTDLGTALGTNLAPSALSFSKASFFNASERYLLYGGLLTGPFAAYVPATRIISGRRYVQLYKSHTENVLSTAHIENMDTWAKYLSAVQSDAINSPLAGSLCDRVYATGVPADSHQISYDDTGIVTGVCLFGVFCKLGTKGVGITLFRYVNAANNYVGIRYNLQTLISDVTDDVSGSVLYHGMVPADGGFYFCYAICNIATIPTSDDVVIQLLDNSGNNVFSQSGEEIYLWGFTSEYGTDYLSYLKLEAGLFSGDELSYAEADVPAWLRLGFTQHIIFHAYSSAMLTTDGGQKIIASFDATAETVTVYLDGADNKVHVVGSVSGQFVESAALTWSLYQHAIVKFEFDNGSNSVLTTSGFTTGNGTVTGTQAAAADGDVAHGMNHTALDEQFDGLLAKLEPL